MGAPSLFRRSEAVRQRGNGPRPPWRGLAEKQTELSLWSAAAREEAGGSPTKRSVHAFPTASPSHVPIKAWAAGFTQRIRPASSRAIRPSSRLLRRSATVNGHRLDSSPIPLPVRISFFARRATRGRDTHRVPSSETAPKKLRPFGTCIFPKGRTHVHGPPRVPGAHTPSSRGPPRPNPPLSGRRQAINRFR